MIKKYPWHIVYLIFVIICLANIFQKLKWSSPTDNITWQKEVDHLVCQDAPSNSRIKIGDILLTVNKFKISDEIDLNRLFHKYKYCRYEFERNGILENIGIDITLKYTPLSYYILAFSGIFLILLTLNILNIDVFQRRLADISTNFYLMSLCFSGFLIFSPTGSYSLNDLLFLLLDKISFLLFPALLLHYSLYYPLKSKILRKTGAKHLLLAIYTVPVTIFAFNFLFILDNLANPIPEILILSINHFRKISLNYFAIFITISFFFFLNSNLKLIIIKKLNKLILPLIGISISIPSLLINIYIFDSTRTLPSLTLFLIIFLPISFTYFLGRRRFTDIENVIKKTVAISSIFLFIFGIYFFIGFNIEQNKLLGIFWSISTILTAGLLFKPLESTVQTYFERIFSRGTYSFKRKLTDLIQSLRTERNLYSLSINFLNTINKGLQLKGSSLLIHFKKNIFYSLPAKNKILLSKNFRKELFLQNSISFFSPIEFRRKFPKDYLVLSKLEYFQFLPLKTQSKLIGLIAFGGKKNNTFLSVEDWELMHNFTPSLTLSVENASLYSELETRLTEINLLKEFNENIIRNINLGIVVLSRLNIIKTWNNTMETKFNIPSHQAINKKAHTVFKTNLWKRIHQGKWGSSTLNNIKVGLADAEIVFNIHSSLLQNNFGKNIGTILVFEDITESILIQNQLITSEKMASLGLLSAGIAHEINTPLTGISSYCQFILNNPDDSENTELVAKIQNQVIRANKIVRTLLNFSRQKGEKPAELNLNKVLNESIDLIEHNLKKKNIEVKREFNYKHKVFGFSTRLQQLFINLLINSMDAINHDRGVISIQGKETENESLIRIKDNGYGIEAKYLKKIFDPFFTTKDQEKGTGLGLSIAYNIMEEHYGTIQVNSKKNKGTTFILTFKINNPLRRINL